MIFYDIHSSFRNKSLLMGHACTLWQRKRNSKCAEWLTNGWLGKGGQGTSRMLLFGFGREWNSFDIRIWNSWINHQQHSSRRDWRLNGGGMTVEPLLEWSNGWLNLDCDGDKFNPEILQGKRVAQSIYRWISSNHYNQTFPGSRGLVVVGSHKHITMQRKIDNL